ASSTTGPSRSRPAADRAVSGARCAFTTRSLGMERTAFRELRCDLGVDLGALSEKVAQQCELVVGVAVELLVELVCDLAVERPGASMRLRGGIDHDAPPVGRVAPAPHVPDPFQAVDDDRDG